MERSTAQAKALELTAEFGLPPIAVLLHDSAGQWQGLYSNRRIYLDPVAMDQPLERVLRHELTHFAQHLRSGLTWPQWLAEYERLERQHGYLNHPWEIEARKAER